MMPETPQAGRGTPSPLDTLTKRQRAVAELVATGMTNRMVANRLQLSEWTVVNHLRQVMVKLGCPSRVHVALILQQDNRDAAQQPVAR